MKIAIVTGASSGMGREFALQISRRYRTVEEVWLLARREEQLLETKELIESEGGTARIVVCDVTKKGDVKKVVKEIEKEKHTVRLLVNNAGYGMMGQFLELTVKENEGMIRLNCEALVSFTYAILPFMRKNGNIINVASSAAFIPQPGFAVYAASKSFVLSFSKALHEELREQGIAVTAVCPGPVKTSFFDVAEKYHQVKGYKKLFMADPVLVVDLALKDAYHRKNISVYGAGMKAFRILAKLVPQEILFYFM